jgi:hypothetical protein
MSASAGHPALRARISEALERYLGDLSSRAVGERLGIACTTVQRRGSDLRAWPADELLHLTTRDESLRTAVICYLAGELASGDAGRVDAGLVESLAALGTLISQAADALRGDHHCNLDEARRLLPILREAKSVLAKVENDLVAQVERGAR